MKVGKTVQALFLAAVGIAAVGCRADARPLEAVAAEDAAAGTACGRPPLSGCPLQQWMSAKVAPPFREGRLERLVEPLTDLADMAPPEFPRWAELAHAGAQAAAAGDASVVRTSCGGCHDSYRAAYRATMRGRQLRTRRGRDEP